MNATIIREKMNTDIRWLERGILAIAARQTADEQAVAATKYLNGCGFNATDARFGQSLADWLKAGKALTERQASAARRMMAKYAGQLERIANNTPPACCIVQISVPDNDQYDEFIVESFDERPIIEVIREKLGEAFRVRA